MTQKGLKERNQIDDKNKWNLSSLFHSDDDWEKKLKELDQKKETISTYQGTLNSISNIKVCLDSFFYLSLLDESLGYYVFLRKDQNIEDIEANNLYEKYMHVATKFSELCSYIIPEILDNETTFLGSLMHNNDLKKYSIFLEKEIRFKSHILSSKEEKLLAGMSEFSDLGNKGFSVLTNVDMNFGAIEQNGTKQALTQSSLISFLQDEDREIRSKAKKQFMEQFNIHKNTIATLYAGNIKKDIYVTRTRNFNSTRERALFPDKIDTNVYDNLISTIHKNLPLLHKYYALRKKTLQLDSIYLYDMRVPLIPDFKINIPYEKAVEIVCDALKPLGDEYTSILKDGLLNSWVDRYENKGKRSGAYSAGSYKGDPFILLNYREDDLNSIFTLAHEAGHSMHSWYSVKNNSYENYNYTIFEAEVASTFNEQLLAKYLLENDILNIPKAYLYTNLVEDIIGTIFRQTMFAEFEEKVYAEGEKGTPLTLDLFRKLYHNLLEKYFGPDVLLDEWDDLEGLRIPHFYRSFYVYKYATGLSAAINLANKVYSGNQKDLDDYLSFLKSGGSQYPLDSLLNAGVDLSCGKPVENAMETFNFLLNQLEKCLQN